MRNALFAAIAVSAMLAGANASAAIILTAGEAGGTAVHSVPGQSAPTVFGGIGGIAGEVVTLSTVGDTITTSGGGAATYAGPFDDFKISFLTPKSIVGFNLEFLKGGGPPLTTGFSAFVDGVFIGAFANPLAAPQKYTITATGADTISMVLLTFAPQKIGSVKQIRVTGLPGGGGGGGGLGGVPEPATWAMMIAGFGGVGAMMRRRRLTAA